MACEDASSEGDGRDEDCTPGCEDCLCCPHPRLLVVQSPAGVAALAVRKFAFSAGDRLISEPEPGEIMHVPKSGRPA
jgi:hypothetical protein